MLALAEKSCTWRIILFLNRAIQVGPLTGSPGCVPPGAWWWAGTAPCCWWPSAWLRQTRTAGGATHPASPGWTVWGNTCKTQQNTQTHTRTHSKDRHEHKWMQTNDRLELQIHTLIYSTQLNWRSKQYIIRRTNYMITEDETYSLQLLIKAFKMWSTELQTSRERRCVSVCL